MKYAAHYQSLEDARVARLFARYVAGRATPLRVLDYACGRGKYLQKFAELGCDVLGVDANAAYVAAARDRGFAACTAEEFESLPTPKFHVVFMSHLIEHLPPEPLARLITQVCARLVDNGILIVITPVPGERFYHDFTHVRPYLPQSIRHALGQSGAPISLGERNLIELVDIYFFRDPFRTRHWRSFYVGSPPKKAGTRAINAIFDALWRSSGGRFGIVASWLGVYRLRSTQPDGG